MLVGKLKTWRTKAGLQQKEAAKRFGISPTYYSFIERGVRTPSFRVSLIIEERTNGFVTPKDLKKAIELLEHSNNAV